jgi:hypothetical protein
VSALLLLLVDINDAFYDSSSPTPYCVCYYYFFSLSPILLLLLLLLHPPANQPNPTQPNPTNQSQLSTTYQPTPIYCLYFIHFHSRFAFVCSFQMLFAIAMLYRALVCCKLVMRVASRSPPLTPLTLPYASSLLLSRSPTLFHSSSCCMKCIPAFGFVNMSALRTVCSCSLATKGLVMVYLLWSENGHRHSTCSVLKRNKICQYYYYNPCHHICNPCMPVVLSRSTSA